MTELQAMIDDDFCYLTTTGRVSGKPHTIEIWFALDGHTIYLLAGGRDAADWVKNARTQPHVSVRLRDQHYDGMARVVSDPSEDTLARRIVVAKYQPRTSDNLGEWGRTALPVAVDFSTASNLPNR